ncbi:hypothetical protein BC939DRAFT_463235 [Gamsiella multidivaricata]|uniref:uncharacterized protein n=1 Tax=Gamsiella multidivaricata TaxID=101098 RepID=UPI00221EF1BD|nr:uncharacterized protein BC939DRAFT_463235 [Gamsiella multidivaricata]KAG0364973.1 hypothetical protein BGZ54_006993 [Gamsiella multidivaricata]KAI7818321.1 hypothetical protein BC939DRAFT_463235 [Gamsiella multidivaricata]
MSAATITADTTTYPTNINVRPPLSQKVQALLHWVARTLSFRKLLRNIRLLILALAFVSLILDAITISFGINVMGLSLSDVSTEMAFLLTPDLLAMMMAFVLLVYSSKAACCCCFQVTPEDHEEENEDGGGPESVDGIEPEERRQRGVVDGNFPERISPSSGIHSRTTTITPRIAITAPPDNDPSTTYTEPTHAQDAQEHRRRPTSTDLSFIQSSPSIPPPSSFTTTTTSNNKKTWSRRRLWSYIVFRILFSLGLAALALYWPARQLSPPMGYLPNMGSDPNVEGGPNHVNNYGDEYRNGTSIRGGNNTSQGSGVGSSTTLGNDSSYPFTNYTRASGTHHDYDSHPGLGHGYANNNSSPGTSAGDMDSDDFSPWCAYEKAFGDNQSAVVYCRAKEIRPIVTYVGAIFVVIELCVAAMAGDFSASRSRSAGLGSKNETPERSMEEGSGAVIDRRTRTSYEAVAVETEPGIVLEVDRGAGTESRGGYSRRSGKAVLTTGTSIGSDPQQ